MKLNKRQFCTAVRTYQSMFEEETALIEAFDISPEWKPGEWVDSYYELLTDMCELDEDPHIGTDLDWFCYETEFGKRKDYCKVYDTVTGRTWTIETPEILYDYIMRD